MKIFNILTFVLVVCTAIYLGLQKKVTVVNNYEKEIVKAKLQVENLASKTTNYKTHLETFRTHFDTTNIVRYQDSVIMTQDTLIVVLNQIVEKQDTVIDVLKADVKVEKRKRMFWQVATGVLAGGLAATLIIK